MAETTIIELRLPADIAAVVIAHQDPGLTDEHPLKLALAIGLFAQGVISLAKAARLAGMTRYEFAELLKRRGVSAYEYGETTYEQDLNFASGQE